MAEQIRGARLDRPSLINERGAPLALATPTRRESGVVGMYVDIGPANLAIAGMVSAHVATGTRGSALVPVLHLRSLVDSSLDPLIQGTARNMDARTLLVTSSKGHRY